MEWEKEQFRIVDDSAEINVDFVSDLLAETYWGHFRPRAIIEPSCDH
jgi:hypothetical protein